MKDLAVVPLVFDAGGLAAQLAEVQQLGATNDTTRNDLDLVDAGRMLCENAFNADVEADLSHREGTGNAGAMALEDDSLEHLHAQLVPFDDFVVDSDGIANPKLGKVTAEGGVVDLGDLGQAHGHDRQIP